MRPMLFALVLATGCGTSPGDEVYDGGALEGGAGAFDAGLAALDGGGVGRVDGGVGGTLDASIDASLPECGDPEVMARYEECTGTRDGLACAAAGGTWITLPLSGNEMCDCPTGQAHCRCTHANECVDRCLGPLHPSVGCTRVTGGSCTSTSGTLGCWCQFSPDTPRFVCFE